MRWFLVIHIILAAVFAVPLVMMRPAEDIIEKRDIEVNQKVATQRFLQADIESLMRKHPNYEKYLKAVAEALRYSDPMSHESLALYDEQIKRGIVAMDNNDEVEKIPERCNDLLRQIADRNARVKMMK
jgi:FtsZ-binding cell division protein ZapB